MNGAISGIRDELVWGILLGPPGAIDLGIAAFVSCMSGGGSGGKPKPSFDKEKWLNVLEDLTLNRPQESHPNVYEVTGTLDDARAAFETIVEQYGGKATTDTTYNGEAFILADGTFVGFRIGENPPVPTSDVGKIKFKFNP